MQANDQLTVLLALYKEGTEQARHHDAHRERITAIVALTIGVVLGLMAFSPGGFSPGNLQQIAVALFIVLLGWLGYWHSWKHYERTRFHQQRVRQIRKEMGRLTDIDIRCLHDRALDRHLADYWFDPQSIRLHWGWKSFHLLIILLGIVLLCLTLNGRFADSIGVSRSPTSTEPPTSTAAAVNNGR